MEFRFQLFLFNNLFLIKNSVTILFISSVLGCYLLSMGEFPFFLCERSSKRNSTRNSDIAQSAPSNRCSLCSQGDFREKQNFRKTLEYLIQKQKLGVFQQNHSGVVET